MADTDERMLPESLVRARERRFADDMEALAEAAEGLAVACEMALADFEGPVNAMCSMRAVGITPVHRFTLTPQELRAALLKFEPYRKGGRNE